MGYLGNALASVVIGVGLFVVGCESSSQSTSSGDLTTSASSSSSSSSGSAGSGGAGGGAGGQGGGVNPTGGNGGMGSGGSGGGGGTGGGGSAYASCADCTAPTGAEQNECQAEYAACMEWKTCVSILNCIENGVPGGPGPCDATTVKGGCCALQCEAQLPDPEGSARFRALNACIQCKTCANVCKTTDYCSVFTDGGETQCKP
jgi:hypothetical protein